MKKNSLLFLGVCFFISFYIHAQKESNVDIFKYKDIVFSLFEDSLYSVSYFTFVSSGIATSINYSCGSFERSESGYLAIDKDFNFEFSFDITDSTLRVGSDGIIFLRNKLFQYIGSRSIKNSDFWEDEIKNPRIQYLPHYVEKDKSNSQQMKPGYWFYKHLGSDEHRAELYFNRDQSFEYYQFGELISRGLWRQVGKKLHLTDNELDQTFTLIMYKGDLVTYFLPCFYELEEFRHVECK
ncbi:hypothetical protein [Salinivirga cyanobacteriivorans]